MAENNSQLMDSGSSPKKTNTAAIPPIYAIVGNSFSACVNHVTLRMSDWGKKRLGTFKVVHIYEYEPWSGYVDHEMGQWTDLLTLPGIAKTPQGRTNKFLGSAEFGQINGKIFNDILRGNYPVEAKIGKIDKIEKKKVDGKLKYAIAITPSNDPKKKETVIADFVDVCSGPGYPRLLKRTKDKHVANNFKERDFMIDEALMKEYSSGTPVGRVLSATAYMSAYCNRRKGTVCIFGSGPLTSSCIEQAFANQCTAVYWVAKEALNTSFQPGRRYDSLARLDKDGKKRLPWLPGAPNDDVLLFPYTKELKFAEGYKVAQVSLTSKKRSTGMEPYATDDDDSPDDGSTVDDQGSKDRLLEIRFVRGTPRNRKTDRFVDLNQPKITKIKSIVVDQLIISAASQAFDDEPGSAAFLVKNVRNAEGEKQFSPINPPPARVKVPGLDKVTFGLQTQDKTFRILGTAGLTHADRTSEDNEKTRKVSPLVRYEKSLPDQARVARVGVTLSAVAVAQANGFFQKNLNDCVNIAHPGELLAVWGLENGNIIYDFRSRRIDPFTREGTSIDDASYPLPRISGDHYRYRPPWEYW